jgi:hypothetical protein
MTRIEVDGDGASVLVLNDILAEALKVSLLMLMLLLLIWLLRLEGLDFGDAFEVGAMFSWSSLADAAAPDLSCCRRTAS